MFSRNGYGEIYKGIQEFYKALASTCKTKMQINGVEGIPV